MSGIYDDKDFVALRNQVPNAKIGCLICTDLHCTNHYEVNTTLFEPDETEPDWLMHLSCTVCKNEWAICSKCNNFKIKMNTNRMISIHRSTYHGKKNNRIRKINDTAINDNKKQKKEESTTKNTINEMINDNDTTPTISNENNIVINKCAELVKATNELFDSKNREASLQSNGQPSDIKELTIFFENDDIIASSQLEYDITVGSSVGDEHTVELIVNNKTINETNIDMCNNDETTVTENSINYDNVNSTSTEVAISNKILPVNLFHNFQDTIKIKSIVSLHVCDNIYCYITTHIVSQLLKMVSFIYLMVIYYV
jgi:hypothetical protein